MPRARRTRTIAHSGAPAAMILAAVILAGTAVGARAAAAAMLGPNPDECAIARALLGAAGPGCPAVVEPPPPGPPPAIAPTTGMAPTAAPKPPTNAGTVAPVPAATAPAERTAAFLINFDFASARIRPDSHAVLDRIATVMKRPAARHVTFRIVGHTDSVGSDAANRTLSLRRAAAVKWYLVHHNHVSAKRLLTSGVGARQPMNRDDPNAAENRRVEIVNLGE